jgi:hypothetical protein
MKKSPFKLDERNMYVIKRVFTIMYILNILSLIFIVNYRQFVLDQSSDQYRDIANVMVFNIVVGVAAILYLGGITFPKIKIGTALLFYLGFVTLGIAFTLIKYGVFSDIALSFDFVFEKVLIIAAICAILVAIFLLFGYLGKRKIEKDLS